MLPARRDGSLAGKKVYVPPMAYGSARAFVSAFRAIGIDAAVTAPSDNRTRELGAKFTSGDECYPAKVTVGDFVKVLETPGCDRSKTVFFLPTADGPCRFGQYAAHFEQILRANSYGGAHVLSPSSRTGYDELGELARPFVRTGWRALVCADILRKLLLKTRPHEVERGATQAAYDQCLDDVCQTLEGTPAIPGRQLAALHKCMLRCRDRFRALRTRRDPATPVIGVVGEIFCRLNTFSNENLIARLEEYGAEAWLSDIVEWVWYTNAEQFRNLKLRGQIVSTAAAGAYIRKRVQQYDEHTLMEPFHSDFKDYEEPPVGEILEYARPYLPREGAFGEMVLNVGKVVYLAKKGVDGIIDISPFTCMNGIVCEAIYPRVSRDLGGLPIRNFYFDGTQSDLDRDLGVYLELARSYRQRRKQ
jgi:predicted nucleotide-binding protein (sugar kinase/HSP70/actin superfamily)